MGRLGGSPRNKSVNEHWARLPAGPLERHSLMGVSVDHLMGVHCRTNNVEKTTLAGKCYKRMPLLVTNSDAGHMKELSDVVYFLKKIENILRAL
jgi:hypothetical protein